MFILLKKDFRIHGQNKTQKSCRYYTKQF